MKKYIVVNILFFVLFFVCTSQKDNSIQNVSVKTGDTDMETKEIIWTTINAWKKADPKSGRMGSYEVTKFAFLGYDFVKKCSIEIKTIIAFYSKMYIYEEVKQLADALGGFSTLEEAYLVLLKDKEHYFKDIKKENYTLGLMEIEINENIVSVKLKAMMGSYNSTDNFRIHENGDIEYLEPVIKIM